MESLLRQMAAPLRAVEKAAPRLTNALKALVKPVYWAVSFQLKQRLRQHKKARLVARSGLFDEGFYLDSYADVAAAGIDPLTHYIATGAAEGRNPNAFFDTKYYLEQNPDVASAGINPLVHYIRHGAAEGRNPSPRFDAAFYLETNADVAAAGINPLAHFLNYGAGEGRACSRTAGNAQAETVGSGIPTYQRWIERCEGGAKGLAFSRRQARRFAFAPTISVVTPVYNIAEQWLRECIESVLAQVYPNWELCLVDDASTEPHVARVLKEYAARDSRIKVATMATNSGIAATSARGLAMASGTYVAMLDHDDMLAPDALSEVSNRLLAAPDSDVIYSDEDKLDERGHRIEPFFKPDWSPNLLMSMNYVCHLLVVRRSLLMEVGGFRAGFDGSQDYDLVLRLVERTQRIDHVPRILYHWRKVPGSAAAGTQAKPYAYISAQKALGEALARRGIEAKVLMSRPGLYSVRYAMKGTPPVSIIIPTRDQADLLRAAVDSIEKLSSWSNRELVIIDNGSCDQRALRYLKELETQSRVLRYPGTFNWSAINNFAAERAAGEYLLFLNNDVEVISPDWIEAMLEHAQRPEVGAVGAKLLFPVRTVQHAGVVLGMGGVAGHAFVGLPADHAGYFGLPLVVRDCSAVTGACMMVRKDLFRQTGGFDESLRVAFNDVDFCLRLRARGLSIVVTPHALLYHQQSASRRALHPREDVLIMSNRWGKELQRDPFYNPNLSLKHADYRLRG